MDEEIKVKSLYKALEILDCFTVDTPELGITEISGMLGLYKSNVHNILHTLQQKGYVEKNPDNGKYKLGLRILALSRVVSTNLNIRTLCLPMMQNIAHQAKEMVYLAVPSEEGEVVYLDCCMPDNSLTARSMLGVKAPMYCTGIGKAMLAFMPSDTLDRVLSGKLHPFTENTIVSRDELVKELDITKKKGYSIDHMEHEYGIKCVGMPILRGDGRVIAGISLSGPSLRFTEEKIQFFAQVLKENIEQIRVKI